MANKQIKDFNAVVTPAGGDLLLTQQAADNVTRKLTYTQLDLFVRVPNADGTKDLGSAGSRFRDLYLSRRVTLSDAAADPAAAGQLQRNGVDLKLHDGVAVRIFVDRDDTAVIEAVVKKLQESGGPTTLTAGAIVDGKLLRRSGTSLIGADSPTPDQQTRNLILNGGLEDWRDGTAVAPFRWNLVGAGATVARDGTNFKHGTFSASLTRVTNDCQLERDAIAEAGGQGYIRSRQYTFAAWVRATVAARVRLRLNDGVGSTFSAYHTGGSAFELLTVTKTLDSLATALKAGLQVDTGDTNGQIDAAMLVEGPSAPAFALRGETSVFRKVFTANGTYTKPSNLIAAQARVVGPGGAGGSATTAGANNSAGGGGGAGSYAEDSVLASAIGATETVAVAVGADASFGTLVVGKAGSAGGNGPSNGVGAGGARGIAGTGTLKKLGTNGTTGVLSPLEGGDGGFTILDMERVLGSTNTNGAAGTAAPANTGLGGSGGTRNGSFSGDGTTAGGAGGSGIVIVQETLVV